MVMLALPIAALDVSYTIPLTTLVILQFHQLIIHSDIGWTFGPFCRLIVSPSFHEVHHSTAPEHLDRNYGVVLAIWDHLFASRAERNTKFLSYSLVSEKLPESYIGQFFVPIIGVFRLAMEQRASAQTSRQPANS
jgi:sterol desaturase/sphingolipid hydroxylase (fatty acid hydroxylase superfamily)